MASQIMEEQNKKQKKGQHLRNVKSRVFNDKLSPCQTQSPQTNEAK